MLSLLLLLAKVGSLTIASGGGIGNVLVDDIDVAMVNSTSDHSSDLVATILFLLYCMVAIVVALLKLSQYIRLLMFVAPRSSHADVENSSYSLLIADCQREIDICGDVKYIIHNRDILPASWMSYVIISRKDLESSGRDVLLHELSHVKRAHSVDLIFMDIVSAIFWFNPIVWLTIREIRQNHEYEADENVISCGVNIKKYQLLLINKAVGSRHYTISNSFNHSNLKNRITMMLRKRSSRWSAIKGIAILPIALLAFVANANPAISLRLSHLSSVKVSNFALYKQIAASDEDHAFWQKNDAEQKEQLPVLKADVMPKPIFISESSTIADFSTWVQMRVTYPTKEDIEKSNSKEEGTVVLSFVIDNNGKLKDITELDSPGEPFTKIISDIIKQSGEWSAGMIGEEKVAVKVVIPIMFRAEMPE